MSYVLYEKSGHVAFVTLNRPEALNAINRAVADELIDIWKDFRDDKQLWTAIISGAGKSFCCGADVKEMERGKWTFRDSLLFGDRPLGPSNYEVWKPIIAVVQGHVNGAGLWLALECDLRIAADNAVFGAGEVKLNIPALIAPFMFHYLPPAIASELLYTAKSISAQRAYECGLVNRVVKEEHLIAEARGIADDICQCGPLAIWASKEMALRTRNMDYRSSLSVIENIAPPVWNSQDSIEAKRAFIEKRSPKWTLR